MSTFGTAFGSAASPARGIGPNDHLVANAGTDATSSLSWSPAANILVSSSWDNSVRVWEVQTQNIAPGQTQVMATAKALVTHLKPVLDTCFSPDGGTVFSGGADNAARMYTLGQQQGLATQIGVHDAPIKCIGFCKNLNLLVTGGWDRQLKFWDCRSQTPVGQFKMPERVYAMDVCEDKIVVATAGRHVIAYDTSKGPTEIYKKESPLKYQTRCITCFPDLSGFAIGSIEGRVGIHYFQKIGPNGKDSFAFKCHREQTNTYAVNAIAFHPVHKTFVTCGSDGVINTPPILRPKQKPLILPPPRPANVFNTWDKDNKQRLKGFPALQRPITAAAFSTQGDLFAFASCYDWSKGSSHAQQGNDIFIHPVNEEEVKPKSKS
ncbi:hypothetical protein MPSEU_000086800 [Mayamaea pseudoterrestris]|nr:hypothetical protein MPSEU_000086800 [Mayamaea pseudoterrestris]